MRRAVRNVLLLAVFACFEGCTNHEQPLLSNESAKGVISQPAPPNGEPSQEVKVQGINSKHVILRWPSGVLRAEGVLLRVNATHEDWVKFGLWSEFYANGALKERGEYLNLEHSPFPVNVRVGWWRFWYPTGQPSQYCQYFPVPSDAAEAPGLLYRDRLPSTDICGVALLWHPSGAIDVGSSGYYILGVRARELSDTEVTMSLMSFSAFHAAGADPANTRDQ